MPEWKTKCRCGRPLEFSAYDLATGRPQQDCDYWCSDGDPETGPHDQGVVLDNGLDRAIAKQNETNDCHQCGAPMLGRKCLRCGWVAPRKSKETAISGFPGPNIFEYTKIVGKANVTGQTATIPNVTARPGSTLVVFMAQMVGNGGFGAPGVVTWGGGAMTFAATNQDLNSDVQGTVYYSSTAVGGSGNVICSGNDSPPFVSTMAWAVEIKADVPPVFIAKEEVQSINVKSIASIPPSFPGIDSKGFRSLCLAALTVAPAATPDATWTYDFVPIDSMTNNAVGADAGFRYYLAGKLSSGEIVQFGAGWGVLAQPAMNGIAFRR